MVVLFPRKRPLFVTKRFYGKLGFGGITAAVNPPIGPNLRFI